MFRSGDIVKHRQITFWIVVLILIENVGSEVFAQGNYTNSKVGYSLQYNAIKYNLIVGWDESYFWLREGGILGNIEVNLVTIPRNTYAIKFPSNATTKDSLFEIAIQDAKGSCASDGDEGSTDCKDTVQVKYFKTKAGIPAVKFFLIFEERTNIIGEEPEQKTVGPYYIVDITRPNSKSKALLVSFRFGQQASNAEMKELDTLVNSIKIL